MGDDPPGVATVVIPLPLAEFAHSGRHRHRRHPVADRGTRADPADGIHDKRPLTTDLAISRVALHPGLLRTVGRESFAGLAHLASCIAGFNMLPSLKHFHNSMSGARRDAARLRTRCERCYADACRGSPPQDPMTCRHRRGDDELGNKARAFPQSESACPGEGRRQTGASVMMDTFQMASGRTMRDLGNASSQTQDKRLPQRVWLIGTGLSDSDAVSFRYEPDIKDMQKFGLESARPHPTQI